MKITPALLLLFVWLGANSVSAASQPSEALNPAPKGKLLGPMEWRSQTFPGTIRNYWIYVPAQYRADTPAGLMVFQDGWSYARPDGPFRVPEVFDLLIHQKEMPVTIGLFINPGNIPADKPNQKNRSNRSFEYDSLGDRYSRFLLEEMIPTLQTDFRISENRELWAIGGISSGGIAAWTVAWERPDKFSKVLCHIGSFTNIRGGHHYEAMIRKTEAKPIRVYLQEGRNDLDNLHGHWPLANRQMAAALQFKEYDYRLDIGDGGHSGQHGGEILAESLRWLWRTDAP